MLQEMLLALAGHPGAVFETAPRGVGAATSSSAARGGAAGVGLRPPGACPVRCRGELRGAALSPPEAALLEGLATLGFHCSELSRWAGVEALPRPGAPAAARSFYRRALAGGLQEILGAYRAAVLSLEREARTLLGAGAILPLSALSAELGEFEALLPQLHALVWRVAEGDLRGGALLGLLHEGTRSGAPALRGSLRLLFAAAHGVFLRQLAGWMAHGLLLDTCGEFFVQANSLAMRSAGSLSGLLGGRGAGAGGGEEEEGETAAGGADEWHEGFRIDRGLLPSYVRDEAAAAALFVGKAVRVLRRPFRAGAREWGGRRPAGESAAMLPAGGGGDAGAWTPEDAAEVMRALEGLHCGEDFDRLSFERTVLHVQSVLAKRLWESLMERASLPRHLQALKDYYLLARGDFFHALLLETGELFATDPKPATAAVDLEAAVGRAALKSNAEGDCFFPLVSPRVRPLDAGEAPVRTHQGHKIHLPAYDAWDGVGLEYAADWPLGLLLTPEVLGQYNSLFQHLFRLRRVQHDLDAAWAALRTQAKQGSGAGAGSGLAAAWRLRHDMSHLVNNLLIYIQVDVIEAQFHRLESGVAAAKDFQETEALHRDYLAALVAQCFLDIPTVSGMLQAVMQLCRRLRLLAERPALDPGAVEALSAEFLRKSNTLYTVLKSDRLAGGDRAPYLRQFLLRLNFNDFVDTSVRRSLQAARKLTARGPAQ